MNGGLTGLCALREGRHRRHSARCDIEAVRVGRLDPPDSLAADDRAAKGKGIFGFRSRGVAVVKTTFFQHSFALRTKPRDAIV